MQHLHVNGCKKHPQFLMKCNLVHILAKIKVIYLLVLLCFLSISFCLVIFCVEFGDSTCNVGCVGLF